jgi:predicted hydrocarbon binding protein
MENKILNEIKFNSEKGGLFYKEVRYLLVRPETLAAFQKAAEKEIGEKASNILYQSGFHGGTLSSKKYRDVFGLSNEEIIRFMMEMGSQIGWGRFELERFDSAKKRLVVKVYYSPFAEAYGPSSKPVCHMIRGVLGGMASSVFGKGIESKEISCLARGDEYCRFEIMG